MCGGVTTEVVEAGGGLVLWYDIDGCYTTSPIYQQSYTDHSPRGIVTPTLILNPPGQPKKDLLTWHRFGMVVAPG